MSTLRSMPGGWVDRRKVARGPNGRGLCRWCSLEVPARRYTFCSEYCVHEWKLRSQPAYLREQVFKRDKGVCSDCGCDAMAEHRRLKRSRGERRRELMQHWGLKTRLRSSLWDADHILPVVEGGGECELANLRTLCLRCHRVVTVQLRERLRRAKVSLMLGSETARNSTEESLVVTMARRGSIAFFWHEAKLNLCFAMNLPPQGAHFRRSPE